MRMRAFLCLAVKSLHLIRRRANCSDFDGASFRVQGVEYSSITSSSELDWRLIANDGGILGSLRVLYMGN